MKNLNSKILFTLLTSTLMSFSSYAVTQSANLNLSGSIGDNVAIAVTPNASASSLVLTTTAVDTVVAAVSETSNAANGYSILAKSSNAGKLVHSSDATQFVAYTIKYGAGTAVSLTATDQTVKTQATGGNYNAVSSNVSISYTGVSASSKKAGTYTDTITFTIQSL